MDRRPVGIFDSGLGGISVLGQMLDVLPEENFVYYGDTRNIPYGDKRPEEVLRLTHLAVDKLIAMDCKAVVIACNTATSAAAGPLRQELHMPVIGMEPALKPAHALLHGGQILVLATPATLHMEKFHRLMALYGEGAVPVEGRGLVECVESGHLDDAAAEAALRAVLAPHLARPTDAIVLGCTHYLFLRRALERIAPGIPLVDGNLGTVRQLRHVLEERGLLRAAGAGGCELHTTGDAERFLPLMQRLLRA